MNIQDLMNFFDDHKIDYNKFNTTLKRGYPNNEIYRFVPGIHDLDKWVNAIKKVYSMENNGIDRKTAIKHCTNGWKETEVFDFLNYLKYYAEGNHMKYKVAQNWFEGQPGYYLHIKKDEEKPVKPILDMNAIQDSVEEQKTKRDTIEFIRHKIMGRLDSAEKLLRSREGHLFSGNELENLIDAIFNLKKKVQLVNKISTSTKLYEDMIIREGNILNKKGFSKAAGILYKLADENLGSPKADTTKDSKKTDVAISPNPPAAPNQNVGNPGTLPAEVPVKEISDSESAEKSVPKGIADFLDNLETGGITKKEDLDDLSVSDNLEVDDQIVVYDSLSAEAQVTPEVNKDFDAPHAPDGVEIEENDVSNLPVKDEVAGKNFDNIIDTAFASLTVNDVIAKLEDLAKIFKTREVPRQLGLVDMMLDALGIASFFPSLSEATNKSLESNNYISTRLEDILSKLRGVIKTNTIDLKNESAESHSPEAAQLKNNLADSDAKDVERKEMRKKIENEALEGKDKETPQVEIQDDLAPPSNQISPKAPIKQVQPV